LFEQRWNLIQPVELIPHYDMYSSGLTVASCKRFQKSLWNCIVSGFLVPLTLMVTWYSATPSLPQSILGFPLRNDEDAIADFHQTQQ
jgi:hypothetical protein